MTLTVTRRVALATIGVALSAARAQAQDFPSRPITLMVGLAAGGITDVTARLYAEAVSKGIGQRVTVENKTGAGGGVAAAYVQNAAPDGYTLLVFSGSQHATVPAVSNANYEPVKGFAPVTFLFNSVVVLTVPADSPAKTMKELHELGRKKPGGLTFGTPGLGSPSHLLGAKILLADKVPFETAHYRGGAPMMADLITGRVDFGWPTLVDVAVVSRRRQAPGAGDRRRYALGPVCPTCRPSTSSASARSGLRAGLRSRAQPACRRRGQPNPRLFIKASQDPELKRRLERERHADRHQHAGEMGRAMEQEWQTMQQLAKTLNLRIVTCKRRGSVK